MRGAAGVSLGPRSGDTLAAAIALLALAAPLHAGDGKLEINQDCAAVGCFAGDTAGFPVEITASGSYILTSNLSVSTDVSGISVTAADASIDLAGFELAGTDAGSADGVRISAHRVEVKNGTIRDFGRSGVFATGAFEGIRVTGLQVVSTVGNGMSLDNALISESVVMDNGGIAGIQIGAGVVRGCMVIRSGGDGILASGRVLVTGNTVSFSDDDGISAAFGSAVIGNVVLFSDQNGINLTGDALVKNNAVTSSDLGDNIVSCPGCVMADNLAP